MRIGLDAGPGSVAIDGFHPGAPAYRARGEAIAARIGRLFDRELVPTGGDPIGRRWFGQRTRA